LVRDLWIVSSLRESEDDVTAKHVRQRKGVARGNAIPSEGLRQLKGDGAGESRMRKTSLEKGGGPNTSLFSAAQITLAIKKSFKKVMTEGKANDQLH